MARIFTVTSGKGGVGKSTFCVNIAKSLCKQKNKVLLIDGDVALRSLDLLLHLDENLVYDWSDVICNRCSKDAAVLKYNENLHLLPSPLEMPENLTAGDFKSMVENYTDLYDYIFIDSPAGIGDLPMIYAQSSNECIIIATPDNVSARSASVAGNFLIKSGIKEEKLHLVINRFNKKSVKKGKYLNIDEIIDITYICLLGVVPEEATFMYSSVVTKDISSRNNAVSAFNNIASRIMGKEIPLNL